MQACCLEYTLQRRITVLQNLLLIYCNLANISLDSLSADSSTSNVFRYTGTSQRQPSNKPARTKRYANLFFVAELHSFRHGGLIVRLGYHFVELVEVETDEVDFLVTLGNLRF